MPTAELLVRQARLLSGEVTSLLIADGRIAALGGEAESRFRDGDDPSTDGRTVLDVEGRLVTPPMVNAHMHLDKVRTLGRAGEEALTAYTGSGMAGAMTSIELASAVKRGYDRSWIIPNVRGALSDAVRHGTLHVQAFVDVDTTAGLEGMEAVLTVREEFRGLVDVQVVAFPQDGLLRDAGAAELCEEAMRLGADVVGGIPWIEHSDRDARAHVDWACRLAQTTGSRVAMLVDDAGDANLRTTEMLAEGMIDHDLVGRAVAAHARALALYPTPTLLRLLGLAQRAGLGFVADPHTGALHLPVREALAHGLPVALGQDDIEDAYYPFGRHNMLEVAFLGAHLLGFLSAADQRLLIELVTVRAARVLGLPDYGLIMGGPGDLCVHDHDRLLDLLAHHAPPRWVVRAGRIIAETTMTSRVVLPGE